MIKTKVFRVVLLIAISLAGRNANSAILEVVSGEGGLGPYPNPNMIISNAHSSDVISVGQSSSTSDYAAYNSFGHMGLQLDTAFVCGPSTCSGDGPRFDLVIFASDALSFTGITDGWLDLQYYVDGDLSVISPSGASGFNQVGISYTTNVGLGDGAGGVQTSCFLTGDPTPCRTFAPNGGTGTTTIDGNHVVLTGTERLQISGGGSGTITKLEGIIRLTPGLTGGGPDRTYSGSVDFLHTALVGGAVVRDNAGNIVSGVTIISQSGYDYTQPISALQATVPEPSTFALLLVSLGLFGFVLRRRTAGPRG